MERSLQASDMKEKKQSVNKKAGSLRAYLCQYPLSFGLRALVYLAAGITVFVLIYIMLYILAKGIPNLNASLFEWEYNSVNVSMMPAIINTILMVGMTLIISVPIGIGAAIYLVEYAKPGNPFVKVIRLMTETLAGIPSIVYGLFGYLLFVKALDLKLSVISGALTLAMMVLPSIIRTAEEALLAVPGSYREGSFGLGAGRLRTIFKLVLPSAMPGIMAGIILAIGRIVGETAALIYTAGAVAKVPGSLTDPGSTLAVHMYALLSEGFYTNQAYATAVVLLVLVLFVNMGSQWVGRKMESK